MKLWKTNLCGCFVAALSVLSFVRLGSAQDAGSSAALSLGDWRGAYICNQGLTRMTLRIVRLEPELRALYAFYAHEENPGVPSGCYALSGDFDPATGRFSLQPDGWINKPEGYFAVALEGQVEEGGATLTGKVLGWNCTTFDVALGPDHRLVDNLCDEPVPVAVWGQF